MKLGKAHRILAMIIALWGMLFMQLAAASSCPDLAIADSAMPAMMVGMPMSGCAQASQGKPGLCCAQAAFTRGSADKRRTTYIGAPTEAVRILPRIAPPPSSIASTLATPELYRTVSPPLSIKHCRFRI